MLFKLILVEHGTNLVYQESVFDKFRSDLFSSLLEKRLKLVALIKTLRESIELEGNSGNASFLGLLELILEAEWQSIYMYHQNSRLTWIEEDQQAYIHFRQNINLQPSHQYGEIIEAVRRGFDHRTKGFQLEFIVRRLVNDPFVDEGFKDGLNSMLRLYFRDLSTPDPNKNYGAVPQSNRGRKVGKRSQNSVTPVTTPPSNKTRLKNIEIRNVEVR